MKHPLVQVVSALVIILGKIYSSLLYPQLETKFYRSLINLIKFVIDIPGIYL